MNQRKIKESLIIVDIGASGGYMIACGSSYIFANPGSITGSIGVITQYYDLSKLITGSFGTLLAISELTLKVLPLESETKQ